MKGLWHRAQVVCLTLLLDVLMGDPPNRYHPVAWMGSIIAKAQRSAQPSAPRPTRKRRMLPLLQGALIAGGGVAGWASIAGGATAVLERLPPALALPLEAALLKMTVGLHSLDRAAREIDAALVADDLPEARRLVSWHLVSRETDDLDASQVAAATIESVAENTSDGVLAPLFYYALWGLPGAYGYRFANTADAMLGYRDAAREWLGKVPARLDDVANLLPARLTALCLLLAAALRGEDAPRTWRIWQRDARRTASPNAGHPMSAMAGALGVELEKIGHYRLGEGQRWATPADIGRARGLMWTATGIAAGALLLLGWLLSTREPHR